MPLVPTSYAAAALGLTAFSFLCGSRHTCECHFGGTSVEPRLLDLLGSQLDRCGPEALNARVCPADNPCPPPSAADATAAWIFACGFAVGVLTAAVLVAAARRSAPPRQRRVTELPVQAEEQVRVAVEERIAPPAGPCTPSARRAARALTAGYGNGT